MRLWSAQVAWNTNHAFHLQWWFKRRLLPRAHSSVFSQLFPPVLHCSLLWGHNGHGFCLHSYMRNSAGVLFCCGHMCHLFLHLYGVGPSPCTKKSSYFLTAGYAGVTGLADMIILSEMVMFPSKWLSKRKKKIRKCISQIREGLKSLGVYLAVLLLLRLFIKVSTSIRLCSKQAIFSSQWTKARNVADDATWTGKFWFSFLETSNTVDTV